MEAEISCLISDFINKPLLFNALLVLVNITHNMLLHYNVQIVEFSLNR
jgi:hypothetical protein